MILRFFKNCQVSIESTVEGLGKQTVTLKLFVDDHLVIIEGIVDQTPYNCRRWDIYHL